jgi:hypothetical protein
VIQIESEAFYKSSLQSIVIPRNPDHRMICGGLHRIMRNVNDSVKPLDLSVEVEIEIEKQSNECEKLPKTNHPSSLISIHREAALEF